MMPTETQLLVKLTEVFDVIVGGTLAITNTASSPQDDRPVIYVGTLAALSALLHTATIAVDPPKPAPAPVPSPESKNTRVQTYLTGARPARYELTFAERDELLHKCHEGQFGALETRIVQLYLVEGLSFRKIGGLIKWEKYGFVGGVSNHTKQYRASAIFRRLLRQVRKAIAAS